MESSRGILTVLKEAAKHHWLAVLTSVILLLLFPVGQSIKAWVKRVEAGVSEQQRPTVISPAADAQSMTIAQAQPAARISKIALVDASGRPADVHIQVDGTDPEVAPDGHILLLAAMSHHIKAFDWRTGMPLGLRMGASRDCVIDVPKNSPTDITIQIDRSGGK